MCCFGASVTAQKQGYVYYLSKLFNANIDSFGYGSNHISDAGICMIDDVIKKQYSHCFIDFFNTGLKNVNDLLKEYIDTIVYKFTKANCKLVFLFFPINDYSDRKPYYTFVKQYLDSNMLYYIDINDTVLYESKYCRDDVHTTDQGAQKYAEIIYNVFQKNKHKIILPAKTKKTIYCDIKKMHIDRTFKKYVNFEGNCRIIGFYVNKGPKSGIVYVNNVKFIIWDKWCHYDRKGFSISCTVDGKLECIISQEKIDTSNCARQFTQPDEKELTIFDIYYIDLNSNKSSLKLINGE